MDVNGMINTNAVHKVVSARKPHRKTRTGCRTCKQRKIKCDEQRPSCNNCVKHSVPCDFMSPDSGAASTSSAAQSSHSPQNNSPFVGPSLLNFNSNPNYDPSLTEQSSLNRTDLHLLHNYTIGTADTLHTDPSLKILFRVNVPQSGFEYDFVMHGILALSAQHLGRYTPEKRTYYTTLASRHHQLGLRLATSLLQNINAENCDAVYIFSALTTFYTFATPRKPGDFLLVGEKGIAEWVFLVKGTSSIIHAFEQNLRAGPFGPLFIAGSRRIQLREQYIKDVPNDRDPLYDLESLIQNNYTNRDQVPIFIGSIELLRKSYAYMHVGGSIPGFEIGDIFSWVFGVSDDYLELLRQNNQESLCIFAYFCVVLRRLESHWWMEGWSAFLIERIWSLLDSEHRLWVRWPVEEIGCKAYSHTKLLFLHKS